MLEILEKLTRNWWVLALRGVVAVLFGIMAFAWPGITLATLVVLFGAYALVDGAFMVAWSFVGKQASFPWGSFIAGLTGIAAGIFTFVWPGITAMALLFVIAAWAILTGLLEIIATIELRKIIEHEWLLALGGAASVAFGVLLMARPLAGALSVIWLIATFALAIGILWIALSFEIRGIHNRISEEKRI